MDSIAPLYINDIGIVFYWKKNGRLLAGRVQLVFRDMGFYLTKEELDMFAAQIVEASGRPTCSGCAGSCGSKKLLMTPYPQIELAVSLRELRLLGDLVRGAKFRLELLDFLEGVGQN